MAPAQNQKQVKQYVDETERFRAEIDEFRTTMKTVNANKCSVCQGPLDPPVGTRARTDTVILHCRRHSTHTLALSVHFLCMHSYHQHCLPESLDNEGPECVICAKSNQQLFETRASLAASSIAHDKFFKQLAAAPDGFVTVAEFLGRQVRVLCTQGTREKGLSTYRCSPIWIRFYTTRTKRMWRAWRRSCRSRRGEPSALIPYGCTKVRFPSKRLQYIERLMYHLGYGAKAATPGGRR